MRKLKIVLIGDTEVGKTCIDSRIFDDTYNDFSQNTIAVSYHSKIVSSSSGDTVQLQLWDTAGQEKFHSITPSYLRQADVALYIYDITKQESFSHLNRWNELVVQNAPKSIKIILVGNKCERTKDRQVSKDEAKRFASSINAVHYTETSAKENVGIKELVKFLSELETSFMETEQRAFRIYKDPNTKSCSC